MLAPIFEWFDGPEGPWPHDPEIVPAESTLLKGESTGPAPR